MNRSWSRPTPKVLATRARLDSTLIGSSPTCPPRLRLTKSPTLDPPRVEVNPQSTPRPPIAGTCSRQWNTHVTLAEQAPPLRRAYHSIAAEVPFDFGTGACSQTAVSTSQRTQMETT